MAKSMQRRKPGYTKSGEVRIVSLNVHQLAPMLEKASTAKKRSQIQRRLNQLGYVAPEPVVEATEEVAE